MSCSVTNLYLFAFYHDNCTHKYKKMNLTWYALKDKSVTKFHLLV
jgi:hypothetical protein